MKENEKKIKGKFNIFNKIAEILTKVITFIVKLIVIIIIGLLHIVYSILKAIYDLYLLGMSKLKYNPKMFIFYLILLTFTLLILFPKQIISYVGLETIKEQETVVYVDYNNYKCTLDNISCKIYFVSKAYDLTKEQSLIAVAISKFETGNYTSSALKNNNNFGGNMEWTSQGSRLMNFISEEEGLNFYIKNLKNNYFDKGLNTLADIQPIYCPIGAENDPTGINKYWLDGVTKVLNEIIEKGEF